MYANDLIKPPQRLKSAEEEATYPHSLIKPWIEDGVEERLVLKSPKRAHGNFENLADDRIRNLSHGNLLPIK